MVTTTTTRAASNFPAFAALGSGNLCAAYGSNAFTANPSAADIVELCRLPRGAVVLGGFLRMGDMDTNGSPTLDIDIGYAANGAIAAAPTGFGNFGVANGTAVTNYTPEGGSVFPLNGLLATGFLTFTAETVVTATVNAVAATFAAGTLSVVVWYVTP